MDKEIKILGRTIDEITSHYFDSQYFREEYDENEQQLLKDGFREGIEYLYPLYENAVRLNECYQRLEKVRHAEP